MYLVFGSKVIDENKFYRKLHFLLSMTSGA